MQILPMTNITLEFLSINNLSELAIVPGWKTLNNLTNQTEHRDMAPSSREPNCTLARSSRSIKFSVQT